MRGGKTSRVLNSCQGEWIPWESCRLDLNLSVIHAVQASSHTTAMTTKTPKVLVPPINFSLVSRGVYRSGHPNRKNFPFLLGLSLKTIIYLESTTYRPDSQSFVDSSFIALHTYNISDESKLFTPKGKQVVEDILRLVLDTRNHPLLIHDDMGKSVVSVICALVRRMERWSLTGIFAEGDMFAGQAGGSEGSGIGEAGREAGLFRK